MKVGRRELLQGSAIGAAGGSAWARASPAGGSPLGGPFLSLTDLGARGDGVSDDTTAITAAIQRCIATGATLYVPAGTYRHTRLRFAPKLREGLRMVGDWAYDCAPGQRGSFFVHDGDGVGIEFVGEGGPFFMAVEGICFVGNPMSRAGVRLTGRSSLSFRRCGWIRYDNPGGDGALHLTRGAQEFVGVVLLDDCSFVNGTKGIVIDRPLTNVINISHTKFIDVEYCINLIDDCSVRSLNVRDCHFENHKALRRVIGVNGTVYSLNFTGNYTEQNSLDVNDELISISKTSPGEISRGVLIEGNFFQKILGAAGGCIIHLNQVRGVSIRANTMAGGGAGDRYWCVLTPGVEDAYVEPPATPNGVTPYPILNMRTGRRYSRPHWSGEDQPLRRLQLRVENAASADAQGSGTAVFSERDGEVTVDFELSLEPSAGNSRGRLSIDGLPFPNGAAAAPVAIYLTKGFVADALPLQGHVAPNGRTILLTARDGETLKFETHVQGTASLSGRAVYRRD